MPQAFPRWTHVVLHQSATADGPTADTANFRRHHVKVRKWRDLGYHFVVEKVGDGYEVLAGRPLNVPGAHCPGMNRRGVGLCFAGDFTNASPPADQLEVAARFLAGLCAQLGIPLENLVPHSAYLSTACPGEAFPVEELRSRVRGYLD
ncbi:MAG: peptidoglycan recognition family protein [Acidobacteriota bacterium]